jgi:hypothetical protein
MNFVTVTCSRDFNMMLLQAHSMKFVNDNITHYVIIQDNKIELEQWQNALSSYYDRHKLILLPNLIQDELVLKQGGWQQQQVLKFKISKFVTTEDYLVLDSKNFFIKPFNVSDWCVLHGHGAQFVYKPNDPIKTFNIDNFLLSVSSAYNKKIPNIMNEYYTPFKLNKKIVDSINIDDNATLFTDYRNRKPSEFALYNFFIPDEEIHKCSSPTPLVRNYFKTIPSVEELEKMYEKLSVIGIHRNLIVNKKLNKNKFDNIIEFFNSKGLDKQLLINSLGL